MHNDPADAGLDAALRALDARQRSPAAAEAAAREVLERPALSPAAEVVALWALGLAERELNRLEPAETHLREAREAAELSADQGRATQIASALIAVVAARGRPREALDLADAIRTTIEPADRADLEMKRALALEQLGDLDAALDAYNSALANVGRSSDPVLEARLRCNRSIVLGLRGRTRDALRDAAAAERLATRHEHWFLAAGAAHNHAYTAGLHGDIVTALDSFGRAESLYARVGHPGRAAGVLASDRCEVLLAAGLNAEARHQAELAVAALTAVDDVSDLAEARLLLARACLAAGDVDTAATEAQEAEAALRQAGRFGWAVAAEFVAFLAAAQSRDRDGATDPALVASAVRIAGELDRFGRITEAATVRVAAAEAAIAAGDAVIARRLLDEAAKTRRRGRSDRRANAWFATARLRLFDGQRAGALRALRAGLAAIDHHRHALGATELRVGAANHAERLAALGLATALAGDRAHEVFAWGERVRANALAYPAVRPPDDTGFAAALTELRRLGADLEAAKRNGTVDVALVDAVRRQEVAVRDAARLARDAHDVSTDVVLSDVRASLSPGQVLVAYVESAGRLAAVVASPRRSRLVPLGSTVPVGAAVDGLSFALGRLARSSVSSQSSQSAAELAHSAGAELDALLVAPLGVGDSELVIVPTGVLHDVPWGFVTSLQQRPLTLAASARRWLHAADHVDRVTFGSGLDSGGSAVIAGPGLGDAAAEMAAVLDGWPEALQLLGDDATVAATLAVLDSHRLAHLACHGHFRSDSPMFSSLALADGALTVYDLESLRTPPALVVLPACTAGAVAVGTGDEVIGTASALLGTGVGAVIAPVTVVNDAATTIVMRRFHSQLATGHSPAAALAAARIDTAGESPAVQAAAASFVCFA